MSTVTLTAEDIRNDPMISPADVVGVCERHDEDSNLLRMFFIQLFSERRRLARERMWILNQILTAPNRGPDNKRCPSAEAWEECRDRDRCFACWTHAAMKAVREEEHTSSSCGL